MNPITVIKTNISRQKDRVYFVSAIALSSCSIKMVRAFDQYRESIKKGHWDEFMEDMIRSGFTPKQMELVLGITFKTLFFDPRLTGEVRAWAETMLIPTISENMRDEVVLQNHVIDLAVLLAEQFINKDKEKAEKIAKEEKNEINTHMAATDILEMFEDVLDKYNIVVPSPEDDEREPDNEAKLYGSTYADLLDDVEAFLIELLEQKQDDTTITSYVYN